MTVQELSEETIRSIIKNAVLPVITRTALKTKYDDNLWQSRFPIDQRSVSYMSENCTWLRS
jgi:hypothetical protein